MIKKIKTLILATENKGKLIEIQHCLQDFDLEILPQSKFKIDSIPETGKTFIENALIKARHVSLATGMPALADDSGLVIDVLNGEPGIFSARYAGKHGDNEANNKKVLQQMHNVPSKDRGAHFYCVMALLRHADDPAPLISTGIWHGAILTEPVGEHGFGYDPIFYVPSQHCSAAELDLTLKNRLSHRGQALQKLKQKLHEFF